MSSNDLVYDPKTKQLIKDRLYEHLYGPVKRMYLSQLNSLIRRNAVMYNNAQEHMTYRGITYAINDRQVPPRHVNRLVKPLQAEMKTYLAELDELNRNELPYVLGYITQVLNTSNSLQDYFSVFPESTHHPIRDLVDSCGCRTHKLTQQEIVTLRIRNTVPINLMKQRMVLNLLLS